MGGIGVVQSIYDNALATSSTMDTAASYSKKKKRGGQRRSAKGPSPGRAEVPNSSNPAVRAPSNNFCIECFMA